MPMSNADGAALAAAIAAAPPRITPTVSQSIRIDWGSWIAQALAHEEHMIEAVAEAGAAIAFSQIPMGGMIKMFVGPKLIDQYVEMAISALVGASKGLITDIPAGTVFATAANLILANEPRFAQFIGDQLDPLIHAGLKKLGIGA